MPSTVVDICNLALGHLGEAPITAISDENTRARACNERYESTLDATLRAHRWNFAQARVAVELPWITFTHYGQEGTEMALYFDADHGYPTGQRVRVKDASTFDGEWVITVPDGFLDSMILDGSTYLNLATTDFTTGSVVAIPPFGWSYQYDLPSNCLRVLEVNDSEDGDNRSPWIVEGRKLLTNDDECRLVYIFREDDVTKWDALFIDAMALALAVKLTEVIRGATSKTEQLAAQYERITAPLARRVDANEARRRKPLKAMNSLAIQARFGGVYVPS